MDEIERPFGVWTAAAMVVGGMIGAGIFVLPAALAPIGWTAAAGWAVSGLGMIAIAQVIIALMRARPEEPSILTNCGDILGLLAGRMLAWSYWTATVCSLPVLAVTGLGYLLHLFPSLSVGPMANALAGVAIIAALSAINLRGVRTGGKVQVATTVLKLVPLLLVVCIVFWLLASAPETYSETRAVPFSAAQLTPALAIVFFALLSFENAALVAERVRDPERNVPRATFLGLGVVLSIYVIVSLGITFALPEAELAASGAPVALFVARYLGAWVGDGVALFAAVSAFGCLNGLILLTGELPLAMVRDGQLPTSFAPTNLHDVAARPILIGAGLAAVLLLGSVTGLGEKVLDFLLRLTTASALWFYVGICLAAWKVRIMRGLALVGLLFCCWMFYSTGLEAGGLGVLLLLVAVPLHFMLGKAPSAVTTA